MYFSYLHMSGDTYGRPIHGQREVSAYPSPSDLNYWQAAEGIYVKPTEAKSRRTTSDDDDEEEDDDADESLQRTHSDSIDHDEF